MDIELSDSKSGNSMRSRVSTLTLSLMFLLSNISLLAQTEEVNIPRHLPAYYGEEQKLKPTRESQIWALRRTNPVLQAVHDYDSGRRELIAIAGVGTLIVGVKSDRRRDYDRPNIRIVWGTSDAFDSSAASVLQDLAYFYCRSYNSSMLLLMKKLEDLEPNIQGGFDIITRWEIPGKN